MGLLSEVTCMPAVSTRQNGAEMTETQISSNFVFLQADYGKFCWFFLELSPPMY